MGFSYSAHSQVFTFFKILSSVLYFPFLHGITGHIHSHGFNYHLTQFIPTSHVYLLPRLYTPGLPIYISVLLGLPSILRLYMSQTKHFIFTSVALHNSGNNITEFHTLKFFCHSHLFASIPDTCSLSPYHLARWPQRCSLPKLWPVIFLTCKSQHIIPLFTWATIRDGITLTLEPDTLRF